MSFPNEPEGRVYRDIDLGNSRPRVDQQISLHELEGYGAWEPQGDSSDGIRVLESIDPDVFHQFRTVVMESLGITESELAAEESVPRVETQTGATLAEFACIAQQKAKAEADKKAEERRILIEQARAQLDVLCQTHYRDMLKVAMAILQNRIEAEDVVQSTCIEILEDPLRHGKILNFKAFSSTITRRRAIDRLRQMQRQKAREGRSPYGTLEAHPDDALNGEGLMLQQETVLQFTQLLMMLPPAQQERVRDKLRDRPLAHLARERGVPERTLQNQVAAALFAIRGLVQKQGLA